MKLIFTIDYVTRWGESLHMVGTSSRGGDFDIPLQLTASGRWSTVMELPASATTLTYSYRVRRDDGSERHEWGHPRHLALPATLRNLDINDRWQDIPADKNSYSALYTGVINRRDNRDKATTLHASTLTLTVDAPTVGRDEVLAVVGDSELLGHWNPVKAIVMNDNGFPTWTVEIERKRLPQRFQFKFAILSRKTGELLAWEGGENRSLTLQPTEPNSAILCTGMRFNDQRPHWRGAGVAIPVFSVRSDDDMGVGDFFDLMKVVDWAVETGQSILQILPINDTTMTHTWTDSYPYNACSTFALHPMYMRLGELGQPESASRRAYFTDLARELNALPTVDYERVNQAKREYIAEAFARNGSETMQSREFTDFMLANAYWLRPYAAFCVLRDLNGTPDFNLWGEYAVYTPSTVDTVYAAHTAEMNLVYYTQYHLDRQMRKVHEYASRHGVAFKGDIPIGISRHSVDAWINPRLFNMDCQAGAPPDDFSVLGQNWGFPTYNWEEMARDGFAWWKARFRKMADYFDAYRIDHVLGFFRIWEIPMDAVHGLLGYFNPALPFSPEELRDSYGFYIDPARHCRPLIHESFIRDFFGEHTDQARSQYLIAEADGYYRLAPQVDTQRKIVDHFALQDKTDANARIADGLLGLVDQVLFIEDPRQRGHYHPRIAAQQTYNYRWLNDGDKYNFNRLYNDFFYRRHNRFWEDKAMWKLPPLLESTDMLTCAEDLGMIPACVPNVMHRLQILSLEIQRMPKDPNAAFGDTWTYPYLSVCTTSTHDMGGIRQWWEENHDDAQAFYNHVLGCGGEAPYFAEPWICDRIVNLQLLSPSMLAILPLQDWLSVSPDLRRPDPREEQINVPANPRHYWRYRMHLTIESLLGAVTFNRTLRDRIRNSGR